MKITLDSLLGFLLFITAMSTVGILVAEIYNLFILVPLSVAIIVLFLIIILREINYAMSRPI